MLQNLFLLLIGQTLSFCFVSSTACKEGFKAHFAHVLPSKRFQLKTHLPLTTHSLGACALGTQHPTIHPLE